MTAGTHGSTFGGNALAMAVGSAVLDIVLAPGFLENVRKTAILFKQRLAEIKGRHPTVIGDVRGEGFLLGLLAVGKNDELVTALRAEKLLAVAAGDNVVRLLPPLIVTDAQIAEAIDCLDRAAGAVERAAAERQKLEGAAG
jgi:acetylornithine/N-succinyldiaminopimelate aminotransferase